MTTRWEVEKAVWHSELEPPARLLVLALAAKSDNDTAVVPAEYTPSLTTLQAMTGLSRSAIGEWLTALEDAGWVKRTRPPVGSRTERTTYALLSGSPSAQRRSRDERKPREKKSTSTPGGLPNETGTSTFGSPPSGLVRQADHSTSRPGGPLTDGDVSGFGGALGGLVRVADHSGSTPGGPGVVRQADPGSTPGGPAPLSSSPTENYSPLNPSHTTREHADDPNVSAKKPRRVTDDDPDFAAFWTAYPRKTDKGHARKAWATALKNDVDPKAIIAAAESFAGQCDRNRTEQRFIPHPTTWLNGERWADQLQSAGATSSPNGRYQPYRNPEDASAYLGDL